jgi:hypothetical protein
MQSEDVVDQAKFDRYMAWKTSKDSNGGPAGVAVVEAAAPVGVLGNNSAFRTSTAGSSTGAQGPNGPASTRHFQVTATSKPASTGGITGLTAGVCAPASVAQAITSSNAVLTQPVPLRFLLFSSAVMFTENAKNHCIQPSIHLSLAGAIFAKTRTSFLGRVRRLNASSALSAAERVGYSQ